MSHRCNLYCGGGWHATVLYSTDPAPAPGHFDRYWPGARVEHEPAREAPLHPVMARGVHGNPAEWHPYLVRWRS